MKDVVFRFFAGIVLLTALAVPLHAAEKIQATYDVTWSGLTIFSMDLSVVRDGERYRIDTDARTRGVLNWLFSGKTQAYAEGLVKNGAPVPALYYNGGRWSGEDYHRAMTFDASGQLADVDLNIPEDWQSKYPREPVPPELQLGPDPLSLVMLLFNESLVQAALSEPTAVRTFDGRRVYEVVLDCDASAEARLEIDTDVYEGASQPCGVDFRLISGRLTLTEEQQAELEREREDARKRFERRNRRGRAKRDTTGAEGENIKLYVADITGEGLVLPVEGEMPSGFGRVKVSMTKFTRETAAPIMVTAYAPDVPMPAGTLESCAVTAEAAPAPEPTTSC